MELHPTKRKRSNELKELEKALLQAVKLLRRMELIPMPYILSLVPGDTIIEKCEQIGVSRQTYYLWLHGKSRPSQPQAERLSGLTGIFVEDIMNSEMMHDN